MNVTVIPRRKREDLSYHACTIMKLPLTQFWPWEPMPAQTHPLILIPLLKEENYMYVNMCI